MLLGVPAVPLEDGSLQVVVDQEVLNWQLLRRQLRLPGQQRNEAHWPVHLGPPTCLRGLLEEVEKRLRVVLQSHLLQRHVGGQGWGWWNPPSPNLPVHPAPEQLAVLLLVLDEGAETAFLVLPHVQQRLVMFLMESRERLDDIRKWRTRQRWHDGGGVPASFPGFRHHCSKVRTKEGSGQGWLVETRVVLLSDKLKQVRTLRVLCTSTLSVASAITLCVRSGCLSRHRPCARVSTPSLNELPFHGGFYPVSTPITAIRHRCS